MFSRCFTERARQRSAASSIGILVWPQCLVVLTDASDRQCRFRCRSIATLRLDDRGLRDLAHFVKGPIRQFDAAVTGASRLYHRNDCGLDLTMPFRLLEQAILGKSRPAAMEVSELQSSGSISALSAALAICAVLTVVSLLVPPFIDNDSGDGFLAWRGTLQGEFNSVIAPDHANIDKDKLGFLTVWSPGQYLVPGAISLLGVPLGVAMTLTVGLSLLLSLVGWVAVVRTFAPRAGLALPVVVLIALFRYSTHAFCNYHGGEVLQQAVTPWLILAAYRVPRTGAANAALLAAGVVFLGFFAKLTGVIVALAALAASGLVFLASGRRITRGLISGAFGAMAALLLLYLGFLARGPTAASETSWSLPVDDIVFSLLAPWVAGISWPDPMYLMFSKYFYLPAVHIALLVMPAVVVMALVLFWRPQTTKEQEFRTFSLWFSGILAIVFILLFIHGAVIWPEERHFRSAGTLLFVCGMMAVAGTGISRWMRGVFLTLCAVMALFGLASFSYHQLTTSKGPWLDRKSWTNQSLTNQKIFDPAAIDFLREAYAREARNALFVLPSYQLALTLPTEARVLAMDFNWATKSEVQDLRYAGRVPGHVFVVLPNTIIDAQSGTSDASKGRALLSAFTDYAADAWKRKSFENTSVFFQ
jgi:hypothetical protein